MTTKQPGTDLGPHGLTAGLSTAMYVYDWSYMVVTVYWKSTEETNVVDTSLFPGVGSKRLRRPVPGASLGELSRNGASFCFVFTTCHPQLIAFSSYSTFPCEDTSDFLRNFHE